MAEESHPRIRKFFGSTSEGLAQKKKKKTSEGRINNTNLGNQGDVVTGVSGDFFKHVHGNIFKDVFIEVPRSVGVIQDKLGRRVPLTVVQEILQKKLLYVNSVLDDAEGKQLNNPIVKDWFNDLKEAAYDAEDLLQELKTEALRQEMEPESPGNSTSTVQEFVSSPPSYAFDSELIITEAEKVLEKLEDIVKQKQQYLSLEASARHKRLRQATTRETASLVDGSGVYGRDQDKEAIVKLLLSNDDDDDDDAGKKISVIPIIGMGGIGKTTLAQLVYNDIRVKQHFKLQAWVCISDVEFDVTRITQTIYESVTGNTYCGITKLHLLQNALKEELTMKRFLLVLDDVWNEDYMEWDKLRQPFESGAFGSKIIVTARNQRVAFAMSTLPSHHLMQISDYDCWLLFARHAFGNADLLNSQHPDLASIGRQIATKCKGLPLAAKSLGGLLRCYLNVEEWEEVLESEIWEKDTNILPALWLSYRYLPLQLKRCFAHCAIFPKDYYFTKSKVVLLWMAEDLLQPEKKKMMEQVGDDYFNDLISRSFFQSSPTPAFDPSGEGESSFTMHDLINDLAKSVSGEFCFRSEDHNSSDIVSKTRHFSYMRRTAGPNLVALCRAKSLHTFVSFERDGYFRWPASNCLALLNLKFLRLLDLTYFDVTELPGSIGNLKHLRYLDLSYSSVKKLPDALCSLFNLQTLLLLHCCRLVELPINLGRLFKLRHIDIRCTKIEKLPRDMGKLKDLQFLSDFVLNKDTGKNIVELKELQHLHKTLCISGLNNIVCERDALEANISGMKYLEKLVLKWGRDTDDSVQDRQVLEQLQPHANLKEVRIESYGGTSFPNWVGDHSFSNLASVKLVDCMFCLSLPPLGQLPSLVKLYITGFKEVESVDQKFYGCGVQPFMSLKELRFEDMLEWQEWCYDVGGNQEEGGIFPNLCKLILESCPKLTKILPLDKFPKLELLSLSRLTSFTGFSISQESKLLSLSELRIDECPKFECFPDGGIDAPKLKKMSIYNCEKFRLMPKGMHTLLPSLEYLKILNCPELESSPEGGLPPALVELEVDCINKLVAKGTQWGLQKLNSLEVYSVFPEEVLEAIIISGMKYLEKLVLKWGGGTYDSVQDRQLLEQLQPHANLKVVRIESYGGTSFPNWVGDHSFSNLASVKLVNCMFCLSLPPLGQLSSLLKLHIKGFKEVESVDLKFYGCGVKPFMSLKELIFEDMLGWQEWCYDVGGNQEGEGEIFPNLCNLILERCPNLTKILPLDKFPKLELLSLSRLNSFTGFSISQESKLLSLSELRIDECPKFECFPDGGIDAPKLQMMSINNCEKFRLMPEGMHTLLPSLEYLDIFNCPELESSPEEGLPPALVELALDCINKLFANRTQWGLQKLNSLGVYSVFPEEVLLPTSLTHLTIFDCPNLTTLDGKGLRNLDSLRRLVIDDCPELQCFPEEGLPTSLSELRIYDCPSLEQRLRREKGEDWPKIAHIPDIFIDNQKI